MVTLLQEVPAWLGVLMALGGAVICGSNIGRTRWAAVLLGGFLGEAIAIAFPRLAMLGVRSGITTVRDVSAALFVASVIGLLGRGAVVAGVAGLLADLRKGPSAYGA